MRLFETLLALVRLPPLAQRLLAEQVCPNLLSYTCCKGVYRHCVGYVQAAKGVSSMGSSMEDDGFVIVNVPSPSSSGHQPM